MSLKPVLDRPLATLLNRRRWLGAAAGATLGGLVGCGGGGGDASAPSGTALPVAVAPTPPGQATPSGPSNPQATTQAVADSRSWRMGFSRVPPTATLASMLEGLNLMRGRAEFVVMQEHVAWGELLAGVAPSALVERDLAPLADHIRGLGLEVVMLLELTDGMARGQEPAALLATGRSLTEPGVQQAYAAYAAAVSQRIRPASLGLATETNAVRLLAAPALYQAVVQAAGAAAAAVRAVDPARELMVSAQVEVAWGLMPGQSAYQGLSRDLADFAFAQVIGLSSYPFYGHAAPEDIPADYYSRLLSGSARPAMVVEGGWPSTGREGLVTSASMQSRYLERHAALLDSVSARGVAQLLLADLDLSASTPEVAAAMALFSSMGVMDSRFQQKPAAATWDRQFSRRLLS